MCSEHFQTTTAIPGFPFLFGVSGGVGFEAAEWLIEKLEIKNNKRQNVFTSN